MQRARYVSHGVWWATPPKTLKQHWWQLRIPRALEFRILNRRLLQDFHLIQRYLPSLPTFPRHHKDRAARLRHWLHYDAGDDAAQFLRRGQLRQLHLQTTQFSSSEVGLPHVHALAWPWNPSRRSDQLQPVWPDPVASPLASTPATTSHCCLPGGAAVGMPCPSFQAASESFRQPRC